MKSLPEPHLPGDLLLRLEREIDRDRRYEACRPDRRFWCRRLGKAERQVNEIVAPRRDGWGLVGTIEDDRA